MTHEEILNLIFSHQCGADISRIEIELHCTRFQLEAKCTKNTCDTCITEGSDGVMPCDHHRDFKYEVTELIRFGHVDGKEVPIVLIGKTSEIASRIGYTSPQLAKQGVQK